MRTTRFLILLSINFASGLLEQKHIGRSDQIDEIDLTTSTYHNDSDLQK